MADGNSAGLPRRAYAILGALLLLTACATPGQSQYSAESIEASVVDEQTGRPVEGVVVVANWLLVRGTPGGRSQVGSFMVLETLTDANGRFSLPAWGPLPNRTAGFLDYEDPEIWFFKEGYDMLSLTNDYFTDVRTKPSIRKSDWSGKVVRLPKFQGTEEQYADHIASYGQSLIGNLYWYRDCTIKQTPLLAAALDRENRRMQDRRFKKGGFMFSRLGSKFTDRCRFSIPISPGQ